MTGAGFLKRVRRLGRKNGVRVRFEEHRGKGSHGLIRYGERTTTLPGLRRDLKPGLLRALCRQLGIASEDLERNR